MKYYLTETSNLIIIINIFVYAILSVTIFAVKSGKGKAVISGFQNVCNFFIALTAFAHLYAVTKDIIYPVLFALLFVSILLLLSITRLAYKECDRLLLNNMSLLFTCGMIMISRLYPNRAVRQMIIFHVVLFICLFAPLIFYKINFWNRITWVYAGVGLAMITAVLIAGNVIHGSKIDITLFGLTFQPSEAVKILFIFFLAALLWKDINLKKMIFSAVASAAFVMVLVLSRDLGSALIFVVVYVYMVYMATGNYLYLILGLVFGSGASVIAYNLFSHVRIRVNIWLDPWSDIDNKGYQIAQSLFSITGGGLFGTGLKNGSPNSIPFCETDFIFSTITEELGIIFSVCMLIVAISSYFEMMRIAAMIHDSFHRMIVYGIAVSLCFQSFLTVGGGIRFIPLTGVTLPLVSYGGTSLLVSMVMYFIVESVYIKLRRTPVEELYRFHENKDKRKKKEKKEPFIINVLKPIALPDRKHHVLITMAIFSLLFTGLMTQLIVYYNVHKEEFINNSYSRQETNLTRRFLRGNIYDRNGELLAFSVLNPDMTQTRIYPFGSEFCHTVGYSLMGKSGIEYNENYLLLKNGCNLIETIRSRSEGSLPAGNSVYSTLDVNLTGIADSMLGDRRGAVMLTEVKTGRILVLVSHPGFDPNLVEENWESLISDSERSALVNRSVTGLYPPGSTFKIFTALEYLREGHDTDNYSYNCTGKYINGGYGITCFHGGSHGEIDFRTSFAKSCNSSFANIGMSLDKPAFSEELDRLMFNEDLPVLFKNSKPAISTYDISTDYKQMQTSIGQGDTSVSPYHINMITMAIANNGLLMKPYIIEDVRNRDGDIIKKYSSEKVRTVMTAENAAFLSELMKAVVEEGTASGLQSTKYTSAGKTGSAEYNNLGDSHAWFTGFAPAEDPEIAVTVIIEKGGTGSSTAVPLAKALFDEYFKKQ